jgi:DNA-binding Lrp family transcriptional regulator
MTSLLLDSSEVKLLGLLQMEFPLSREPFRDLGLKLGISAIEVIQRIQALKSRGMVRQISPVLDARKLGYQSTLVAIKVPQVSLPRAEGVIRSHPGVSHAYLREHEYNLWITLALPQTADIQVELERVKNEMGAEEIFDLPALKVFKLRAYFDAESEDVPAGSGNQGISEKVELSPDERRIVNQLQQDLSLILNPFDVMAGGLGMDTEEFLAGCGALLKRGVIRRYGAAINHRNTGFKANAMVCWAAEGQKAEVLGQNLALLKAVSHCYIRKTNPRWEYNLFAMIHGHTAQECEAVVQQVTDETGLTRHILLYSTQEFKKTRIIYRV